MPIPHVSAFINLLVAQAGDAYRFGHEVDLDDPDPEAFDCSELVEWACARVGVVPKMPDGSWLQARHCKAYSTLTPIDSAIKTPGALLFRFSSSPFEGDRPTSSHVAVSLGDGRTIEARGTAYGTGIFNAKGRTWTHAGLVPGLSYGENTGGGMALSQQDLEALDWLKRRLRQSSVSDWADEAWAEAMDLAIIRGDTPPGEPVTVERMVEFMRRERAAAKRRITELSTEQVEAIINQMAPTIVAQAVRESMEEAGRRLMG